MNIDYEVDVDEYLDAFVALGGQADRDGTVSKTKLIEIIKLQFELTIDMEVSKTCLNALIRHFVCILFRNICRKSETRKTLGTRTSVCC